MELCYRPIYMCICVFIWVSAGISYRHRIYQLSPHQAVYCRGLHIISNLSLLLTTLVLSLQTSRNFKKHIVKMLKTQHNSLVSIG